MATSLANLIARLVTEIRMDKNHKIWSTAEKAQFINDAYYQTQKDCAFEQRANFTAPVTVAITPGVQEYDLPANFAILKLIQFDGEMLAEADLETDIEMMGLNGSDSSKPSHYYIYGDKFGLYPTPNTGGNVKIFFRRKLPLITEDQASLLPEEFDNAITKYAAYLLWSTPRGNRQTAQDKVTDYEQVMNTLRFSHLNYDAGSLHWKIARSTRRFNSSSRSL